MRVRKILIVEDNNKNMRLIKMLLSNKDYLIFEAADGTSALNIALQKHPDLIIMDIQLPGISGLEVTRKLRNTKGFETIPIIALTAYAMKGDPEQFLRAGCTAYISKPIDTRTLPVQIEYWLNKAQETKH